METKNQLSNEKDRPGGPLSMLTSNRIAIGLVIAFMLAATVTAYLTFSNVRKLVLGWNFTDIAGIMLSQDETPLPGEEPADIITGPLQDIGGPTPVPWDGASRVSVLVMGLDFRDWEEDQGAPRTDTMILFTIDPLSRTAGMLSIPRDLWVNIPGFEPNKINVAYRFGEIYELPGGGPGLAMSTVEGLLGVPINFYALVDFYAFERFIDEIGGIDVDVPEDIKVDPIGPGNTVFLEQGVRTLSGEVALAYARARNTEGGDFDRAQRQQQVTLAIRDQILRLELLPILISKAPVLYQEIASGVHTNLSLEQALKLAVLATQIADGGIKRGTIGPPDLVRLDKSPEGLDILKPVPDQIRILRDEIFTADSFGGPAAVAEDPFDLVTEENARLSVLNGTFTAGLAADTSNFLLDEGLNVTQTDNAGQAYNQTTLIVYTGKPYTVQHLATMMRIEPNRIFFSFDPASDVDVEINLGEDWAFDNPMN